MSSSPAPAPAPDPAPSRKQVPAKKPAVVGRRLLRALWRLVRSYWSSPDARWALLGEGDVQLVATAYDAEAALDRLAQAGFPLFEQWCVRTLHGEVGAEEATASFESRPGT